MPGLRRLRELALQGGKVGIELLETLPFGLQLGHLLGQLFGRDAVLARQRLDAREALLELGLPHGVRFEIVEVAREFLGGITEADERGVERGLQRGELRVELAGGTQQAQRTRGQGMRVGVLGLVEQLECAARTFGEAPAVGEAGALLGERGEFAALEGERFEFLHLMLEQIEPVVSLAGGRLERGEGSGSLDAQPMQSRDFCSLRFGACVPIEQIALCSGAHQRLKLVLAVDLGEPLADLAQHLHRYGLAVEVGARLALAGDEAPHQQLIAHLDALFFQERPQTRRRLREIEGGGDLGACCIVANDFAPRAGTHGKLQRIDQDGFACARFAGEHAEAATEFELDRIDDREIADVQVGEHGRRALVLHVEAAPAPVELAAQQSVVVVARRVQQRDALRRRSDGEPIAGGEASERAAIANHFGVRVRPIREAHLDDRAGRHHDGAIGEGVRADRRDYEHIEVGLDDGATAGERIGGGACGGGDHEAIAAMRVDEALVDPGLVIDEVATLVGLHDDVVQGEPAGRLSRCGAKLGREQRAFIAAALPGERRIDGGQHVLGHHVRQKPQSAAVDAEQRCAARGDETRAIEQRAITADGHHEVYRGELSLGHEARAQAGQALGLIFEGEHRDPTRR